MRRLTLVRHAKAEPPDSDREDWERELEARGEADASIMGQRLRDRDLKPDRLLSSPARRAIATAQLVAKAIGFPAARIAHDERLYLADHKMLRTVVSELGGDAAHVMVVGHNPGLTDFASKLGADHRIDNLPTAAVFSLEFDIDDWSKLDWEAGVNVEFDYPKASF